MSVAEHAERLLTAWCAADAGQLDREVEDVLGCGFSTSCYLEYEERELLQSIAGRLRFHGESHGAMHRSNSAELALLRHLMNRRVN